MPFTIFEIREIELNRFNSEIQTFVYLSNGDLYGNYISDNLKGYLGRNEEDCLFKIGDIVQFLNGDKLEIGIVSDLPPTEDRVIKMKKEAKEKFGVEYEIFDSSDDSYTVLFDNDLSNHSHPLVQHVFKLSFDLNKKYQLMMRNNLMKKMNG